MNFTISKRNRYLFISIAILLAVIPILTTAFQVISTDKTSVVFLEGYHPIIARSIEVYYIILFIVILIWMIFQVKAIIKLRNEKRKNELLHLQSQVNPHFFFNILNNLYGLIDIDSEKAKALILKLSDLMRYSIYEGERSKVSLSKEIDYLKNYIELHQMRYHKNIQVDFNKEIDQDTYQLMPLLFIILVENAFKHGVENLREGAFVTINLIALKGSITFKIENNYDEAELPSKSGIGIQNLKRRLALVYPNKHSLNISKADSIYTATLHLEL